MASDKTCEKLITREVLCFSASKLDALDSILDALDSSLDTRSFRVSRIEDRVAKFEFRGTVNLHLHGTVRFGREVFYFGTWVELFPSPTTFLQTSVFNLNLREV